MEKFRQVIRLWVATYKERLGVAKYVVSKGTRIASKGGTGTRPELHIAVWYGNLQTVKYLVEEYGADIQQRGAWYAGKKMMRQVTLLWVASYRGKQNVARVSCKERHTRQRC